MKDTKIININDCIRVEGGCITKSTIQRDNDIYTVNFVYEPRSFDSEYKIKEDKESYLYGTLISSRLRLLRIK